MQVQADALRRIGRAIFEAAGSSPDEAGKVAARLVDANLTGHDSHGVIRIAQYLDEVRKGTLVPNRRAQLVRETDVIAVFDGQFGYGQIVAEQAVSAAIGKARRHGIALAALRRAGHLGRLGDWAELAAAEGLISLHFVNAVGLPLRVVPHGGRDGRGTTNPIAIGIPIADRPPVILDFATASIAEGKVRVARNKGVAVPPDCLLDAEGRPTTDPRALYGDPPGNLLPFGGTVTGHKGGALWLLTDLLAGSLTGGGCSRPPAPGLPVGSNLLSIVIAPELVADADLFAPEVGRYVAFVKTARPRAEGGEVLVPGEPEQRTRAARLADGIPIDPTTWDQIMAAAERVGLRPAELTGPAGTDPTP